jgi:hypothetical protein
MNLNYRRGRQKEYELKERYEKDGYIVFRTSGSHGIADLICVKPRLLGEADLFPEVKFVQVKCSIHCREEKHVQKIQEHLILDWYYFPVKTKEFYAERIKRRERTTRMGRQQPKSGKESKL